MHELPKGWTWARISDVTEKVPNVKPDDDPEREFCYVDISSISNADYRITEAKRFKGKDAPSRARRPIRAHDVLFSNVRTYLRNIAIVRLTLKRKSARLDSLYFVPAQPLTLAFYSVTY
jgi:type I restriction enzyme S subunit